MWGDTLKFMPLGFIPNNFVVVMQGLGGTRIVEQLILSGQNSQTTVR